MVILARSSLSIRSTIYHNMQYICGTHRQVYVKWYLPIFWSLPLCCCIIITCSLRWPVVDELRSHNETWPILLIPDILPPTHSRYSIYVYIGWISYASFVCLVLLCRDRSHYRCQSSETMCMQFWKTFHNILNRWAFTSTKTTVYHSIYMVSTFARHGIVVYCRNSPIYVK